MSSRQQKRAERLQESVKITRLWFQQFLQNGEYEHLSIAERARGSRGFAKVHAA